MSVRSREEDDNKPHVPRPPQLMGGDGTSGPGVVVPEVVSPRKEQPITLRLHNPDSGEFICSVECDRDTICASSNLIKNLLDNIGDDEMLAPFSTEHIADERTLRRVVEFAELEKDTPEARYDDRWLARETNPYGVTLNRTSDIEVFVLPRAKDFCEDVRHLFHKYINEDGNRSGLLDLLIAAHYLCCTKLRVATAAFLGMQIKSWSSSLVHHSSLLGPPGKFGTLEDPLCNVPIPVLMEITNRCINRCDEAKGLYDFSTKLFQSVAHLHRVWNRKLQGTIGLIEANFTNPECRICLAMEQRLEQQPDEVVNVLLCRAHQDVIPHERWAPLLDKLIVNTAKGFLLDAKVPHTMLKSDVDLGNPFSIPMAIVATAATLDPSAMVYLPRLPRRGVDGIAARWRNFYNNTTRKAPSVSIELLAQPKTTVVDVTQLVAVLAETTNLRTLEIREEPDGKLRLSKKDKIPKTVGTLMDSTTVENVVLESPSDIVEMLPTCLKRLKVRNIQKPSQMMQVCSGIFGATAEDPMTVEFLEDLVLSSPDVDDRELNKLCACLDTCLAKQKLARRKTMMKKKNTLCIYIELSHLLSCVRTHDVIASFRPYIEFYHVMPDFNSCWRYPASAEEGSFADSSSWFEVEPPSFALNTRKKRETS